MVLSMIGCAPNIQYRTSFVTTTPPTTQPSAGADPRAIIESCPDYTLGYVEFDDQGWFWDPSQREYVEAMVRAEAGLPPKRPDGSAATAPSQLPAGIILVTFVHGWKENAAYDGDGAASFRAILFELNRFEQKQAAFYKQTPRKVVGVYAGWRGLSATWEPFKELSIFERKETAHKVGGYGALTKLFTDLENIQRDSLDSLDKHAPRTELIIIGHSLGAGAVYSALSQIVTERFVNSIGKGKPQNEGKIKRLKPLGDQIILINPAFEAVRYFDLYQLAKAAKEYPDDQRPVLSIFTSRGDWATHYVFPIYRFVATLFDYTRPDVGGIDQKAANLDSVGWFDPFITHELDYSKKIAFTTTQPVTFNAKTQTQDPSDADSIQNIHYQRSNWQQNGGVPNTYHFDHSVLKPVNYKPGDPFLVVSVDKKIMDGHNDYANWTIVNFIREYIDFCRVEPTDRSK